MYTKKLDNLGWEVEVEEILQTAADFIVLPGKAEEGKIKKK